MARHRRDASRRRARPSPATRDDRRPGAPPRRHELGQHDLRDAEVVAHLIARAGVRPGERIVDVGAGTGTLTVPLAEAGARVLAIEVDPRRVAVLRAATAHHDVEVVQADLRAAALPAEPFRVVASPPWGLTTSLLRRLLAGDAPLADATLVVQREAARRLSAEPPVGRAGLAWAPWYELTVGAAIDRRAFRPPPSSDAAVLQVRPRPVPELSPARFAAWDAHLDAVFAAPGRTVGDRLTAVHGARPARAIVRRAGVDVDRPPSRLDLPGWLALFRADRNDRTDRADGDGPVGGRAGG